ncbi:MAG: peptidylprolyl isomerase [Pseudomonadota bacterium]
METVENGLFVRVDYTGTLQNGEVFDSSRGRRPLEFKVGAGQMIPGFDAAVAGMSLNEKKTITLAPEEAYGAYDDSLTREFPRADVPPEMNPQTGQRIGMTTPDGHQIPATITQVDDEKITIDMNHPLAGESLTFDIEVVGISDTATQAPSGCGSGCDCSSGCC